MKRVSWQSRSGEHSWDLTWKFNIFLSGTDLHPSASVCLFTKLSTRKCLLRITSWPLIACWLEKLQMLATHSQSLTHSPCLNRVKSDKLPALSRRSNSHELQNVLQSQQSPGQHLSLLEALLCSALSLLYQTDLSPGWVSLIIHPLWNSWLSLSYW